MKRSEVGKQIRERIGALMTAAFGLVAALAWNGAIRAIFAKIFGDSDTVLAMLLYAIIVTIIAVLATIVIARSIAKQE